MAKIVRWQFWTLQCGIFPQSVCVKSTKIDLFLLFWKKGPEDTQLYSSAQGNRVHVGPKFPAFAPILIIVQCTMAAQFY